MPFLGPSPNALSGKIFQSTGTYTNDATLRSGFFSMKRVIDGPAFWIFFKDSRIRVKGVPIKIMSMWVFLYLKNMLVNFINKAMFIFSIMGSKE